MLKSIWAVVAGFLTVVVFSMGTDKVLEATGIFPPPSDMGLFVPWMLAFALVYRTIYTVLGGYVTAWLAPQNPMKHVWVLAILGQLGGIMGVVAGWNLSAHWYPIALAVLAIPSVWLGGYLRTRKSSAPTPAV
jgi:hypothetical protein